MICKCQSCRRKFDRDEALVEHFIGGETERFCPFCGSDDIVEVKRESKRPAH